MRGKVTERNGAKLPWLHRIDFRVSQDLNIFRGQHKLQLTFDVLNIGNLIDSSWGVSRLPLDSNPMVYQGPDANGNAQFTVASEISSGAKSFIDNVRSEEHTSELQSRGQLVCRLRREKK